MTHYGKLGTLAIRWIAVGFFILAVLTLGFGVAGPWGMGGMMGYGGGIADSASGYAMPGGYDHMMGGGYRYMMGAGGFWWGGALVDLLIGGVLWALSRPIGSRMASGLTDE